MERTCAHGSPPRYRAISSAILASLLVVAPLAGQEIPRAVPAEVGMSGERLDELTEALEAYVAEGRLPGAVATVLRDGKVVYSTAVGTRDRESGAPMREDVIFRIASQTKAIVSVGIMMLQEEGALLLTDPVSKYFPEFGYTIVADPESRGRSDVEAAHRPITIHDLITHTAGIGYGSGPGGAAWEEAGITGWYFAHRDEPVGQTVMRMASLPFQAQPGERWVYGYSTDILGAIIEVASGSWLDDFLQERIFDPLDMRDTHFYLPREKRGRLATVYNLRRDRLTRAPDGAGMQSQGQYVDGPRVSFSGGAGLLSTARDYSRFLQMLLDGGTLGGERVLSATSVGLMSANHVGEQYGQRGWGFGLGFSILTDPDLAGVPGSEGAYGWGGAYHSTYWIDPAEDLVVTYFTQVIPAAGLDDHARVRELVYSAITGPVPEPSAGGR